MTPKYILEKKIFGRANKLTAGVDYYLEPFKMDRYADRGEVPKLSVVDLERETTGYYLRDEFNLVEPLILSAGYRWKRRPSRGTASRFPARSISIRKKCTGEMPTNWDSPI